jgi:site-specific DNA-cytosine methylase
MVWDEPAPTLTTQFYGFGNGRFGHPEQDRGISLREGAILQGFPNDYSFVPDGAPIHFKSLPGFRRIPTGGVLESSERGHGRCRPVK